MNQTLPAIHLFNSEVVEDQNFEIWFVSNVTSQSDRSGLNFRMLVNLLVFHWITKVLLVLCSIPLIEWGLYYYTII